ncbi:MAG: segregation/condensation protein A [Firmicutes bacterium]|nr:segregation/condensation protein A [Bacillota bacterium]
MSYKVSLPTFEGPFDLLVYLIENAKMSIYDIQISVITEQYMDYIEKMQAMDFTVAAEFMVLAATLIDIKSRMILPRYSEGGEEGEETELIDPRTDLVAKILEYKKYKDLAEILREAASEAALVYDKPQEDISQYTDNPDEYLSLSLDKFVTAFEEFLQREKRLADVRAHYQRVEREKATIESRIGFIRNKLRNIISQGLKKLSIRELIPNKKDKYDVIVTFVSVLQMMKDRLLDAEQKRNYADILVKPFRAAPIADDPDDGLINAGEPNDSAPSRYKRITDETEARIKIVERTRKRKDADMTIVQQAKEIDKAAASVTAIIDAYEKEKREAEEAAKAAAEEEESGIEAESATYESAETSEELISNEESAENGTEENIDGGQQES